MPHMLPNHRYYHTLGNVLDELENAHLDIMHQARLFAIETDLKQIVEEAMNDAHPFFITNEMLHTCDDENVKRCLRSAEMIVECLETLGSYYRKSPEANEREN